MNRDPAAAGVEHQLRDLAPRVLGAVVRRCGDFAAAEDAVQEALFAAATEWPLSGLPQNPGGWLFHVACRRIADHVCFLRDQQERCFEWAKRSATLA